MSIHTQIYKYNRNPAISDWFKEQLDNHISFGMYHNDIKLLADKLIQQLTDYKHSNRISTVVLGMSGGIDSAVTAALFKQAGYRVIGVTLPIHQNPAETARGVEACEKLDLEHIQVDLTEPYETLVKFYADNDIDFNTDTDAGRSELVRMGNIRARLRMITLYNLASKHNGFVASTDNFSELAAGFWTLHGDVGDVAPIQSLTKSWEVPALAEHLGVPQSIIDAKPTDGLGIANGDEDQFGYSYLEFDIGLLWLLSTYNTQAMLENASDTDVEIINNIIERIRSTTYKRSNPSNLPHPIFEDRYMRLEALDQRL